MTEGMAQMAKIIIFGAMPSAFTGAVSTQSDDCGVVSSENS